MRGDPVTADRQGCSDRHDPRSCADSDSDTRVAPIETLDLDAWNRGRRSPATFVRDSLHGRRNDRGGGEPDR